MSEQNDTADEDPNAQPLVEHLIELRDRLLHAFIAVFGLFLILVYWSREIYAIALGPILAELPGDLITVDITAGVMAPIKVTFFASLFLCIPFLLYQIWAFVAPALYRHERNLALPILLSSIVLFYSGIAFAYFVVFPLIFNFLVNFAPDYANVSPDITTTLNLVLGLFMVFGVVFEIPIAVVILILLGAVSADQLASARRYVIVGCFIIGMLFTPPDPFSQSILAIPMWMLFEVGILAGRLLKRNDIQAEATDT